MASFICYSMKNRTLTSISNTFFKTFYYFRTSASGTGIIATSEEKVPTSTPSGTKIYINSKHQYLLKLVYTFFKNIYFLKIILIILKSNFMKLLN